MTEREFLIRVSYMEIYNEEINDLLVVENQKLQIHESLEVGYLSLNFAFSFVVNFGVSEWNICNNMLYKKQMSCKIVLILSFIFQRGVFVAGLREEIVNNAEQVLDLLKVGEGLYFYYCILILIFIFKFEVRISILLYQSWKLL